MIKLYFFLFKNSHQTLKKYDTRIIDDNPKKFIEKTNFRLNVFIFKSLSREFDKLKNHQHLLGFINSIINNHLQKRLIIYKYSKPFGFRIYILFSFINLILFIFHLFIRSIKNYLSEYRILDLKNLNKVVLCVGFPTHAFSVEDQISEPNSFIEFIINQGNLKNGERIISLDEYIRPSKNNGHQTGKIHPRIIIKKKLSIKRIFLIINFVKIIIIQYFKEYKKFSFFFFYYLFQRVSSNSYDEIYQKLISKNIQVKEIYFIHNHNIGISLNKIPERKIKFFNYSQNNINPMSNTFYKKYFDHSYKHYLVDILREIDLNVFNHIILNQINFNMLVKHIESFKTLINKNFGINLKIQRSLTKPLAYSNLGYESIVKINLSKTQKNILLFDVTPENKNQILKRLFTLDLFSTFEFMETFLKEVSIVSKKYNANIYFKPKYEIKPNLISPYEKLIKEMNMLSDGRIKLINSYSKIKLHKTKFDLSINTPYTSTFYSFGELSKRSVYYIPDKYSKSIVNSINENVITGIKNLEKILKNG